MAGASFLFSFVLLSIALQFATAYPRCSLTKFRNNCGPEDATELVCLEHGCCWSEEGAPDEPKCFHKNDGYKYFSTTITRIDCGWPGFSVHECLEMGCYHHDSDIGPSCFFPNTNIEPSRCGVFSDRIRCGDGFTRQEKCESLGCCWSPMEEGSKEPWCFFPPRDLSRKFQPRSRKKSSTSAKPKSNRIRSRSHSKHTQ